MYENKKPYLSAEEVYLDLNLFELNDTNKKIIEKVSSNPKIKKIYFSHDFSNNQEKKILMENLGFAKTHKQDIEFLDIYGDSKKTDLGKSICFCGFDEKLWGNIYFSLCDNIHFCGFNDDHLKKIIFPKKVYMFYKIQDKRGFSNKLMNSAKIIDRKVDNNFFHHEAIVSFNFTDCEFEGIFKPPTNTKCLIFRNCLGEKTNVVLSGKTQPFLESFKFYFSLDQEKKLQFVIDDFPKSLKEFVISSEKTDESKTSCCKI